MGKIFEASARILKAHRVSCQVCNTGKVCSFAKGVSDGQRKAVAEFQGFGVDAAKRLV